MRRLFLFVLAVLPLGCCCGEQDYNSPGMQSPGQDTAVTQPSQPTKAEQGARPEAARKTE